ncbi:unnamed protein product [Ectocarpus sp. 13 AM-2016]
MAISACCSLSERCTIDCCCACSGSNEKGFTISTGCPRLPNCFWHQEVGSPATSYGGDPEYTAVQPPSCRQDRRCRPAVGLSLLHVYRGLFYLTRNTCASRCPHVFQLFTRPSALDERPPAKHPSSPPLCVDGVRKGRPKSTTVQR